MKNNKNILKIGILAGVISAMLPSVPTMYWMWKERLEYRWILILMLLLTALILSYIL